MNFTVYEKDVSVETYEYKNQTFKSREEFESYIVDNMEVRYG